MIIRHMQGTFGTLDGEQLRLDTGLNIIYAPNESGKSTWCAFLRAMLYGIDTSQRARAGFVPDKQKYAPWSGKPMAGELELEQDGKRITIRRWTEAANAPMRAFSAVYTGTDIPVPGLTANDAGEQLTGVSAEVFQRSAFIGQGGLVVTGTPELERRISAIVTSGEEASSYTEADAQLRAWLRRRRSGQHGALPELEQRIADTETQLHRLERNAQEQAACAAELRETEAELQTVTDLPLQIDTSDFTAMERAMRIYNGKPLINSVNGKEESLNAILPLVKKYGGGLVCLALDDNGIPATAEGRVAIAEKIIARAEALGIPRRELLVDGLTMPVSAGGDNAKVTLATLAGAKKLGVKTALGVSNVSFGLPKRDHLNQAFFTMALYQGLDGAIINPMSAAMMGAFKSYRALLGLDDQCQEYMTYMENLKEAAPAPAKAAPAAAPAEGRAPAALPKAENTLNYSVCKGLKEAAAAQAKELAEGGREILDIINGELVPALDEVGKAFEKGKLFLPQLLMSAEAAKEAFQVLKEYLPATESHGAPQIVLATVKGDIHDIGKNIVKVLLESYRFRVLDLGKDVPPEAIVEAVRAQKIPLVGLSALMTTTAPYMKETIQALHEAGLECKVVVGGAVITQDYADEIRADHYAADAMETVHYAQEVLGG